MKFTNLLNDDVALAELGARLAAARLAQGLTQADLATAAGVSKSTVERLESGASSQLANLLRCLRALGLLENLERMVPETAPSPIDLLERKGRVRRRARAKGPSPKTATPWTWGES